VSLLVITLIGLALAALQARSRPDEGVEVLPGDVWAAFEASLAAADLPDSRD
jgi:hypothetical protein